MSASMQTHKQDTTKHSLYLSFISPLGTCDLLKAISCSYQLLLCTSHGEFIIGPGKQHAYPVSVPCIVITLPSLPLQSTLLVEWGQKAVKNTGTAQVAMAPSCAQQAGARAFRLQQPGVFIGVHCSALVKLNMQTAYRGLVLLVL